MHRAMCALSANVLAYGAMQTMLVPALPAVRSGLHASSAAASFAVMTSMLVSSAIVTPFLGRWADRVGPRPVLLTVLSIYFVGTVTAVVAPTIQVLIASRVLQGGGLALIPLSFGAVELLNEPERTARRMGALSALVTGSAGGGLLVGAVITQSWGWRSVFVVGSVIVAVAWAATYSFVPDAERAGRRCTTPGGVRVFPAHVAAFALGVTQFVLYVQVPALSVLPSAAGQGASGFGTGPIGSALILLPGTIATVPVGTSAHRIERRFGVGTAVACALTVTGLGALGLALHHDSSVSTALWYAATSCGFGATMALLPRAIAAAVPQGRIASANAVNTVSRTVGGAVGSQVGTAIVASVSVDSAGPRPAAFAIAFAVAGAASIVAAPVAALTPRTTTRAPESGARVEG